ncbi:hypothetical protein BDC45DRAFT_524499 [Circinella umbellata]|nr:hypothetical protein BDC45DRAFT_524499 [Circinella umbellata]
MNFGNNNCFQVGDSNHQIINQVPDNSQIINQSYRSESDESNKSDLSNIFDDNDDHMLTNRQDFRTKLFDVASKKLRNDCTLEDVVELNRMERLITVPTTIGHCLDDLSFSLINKENNINTDLLKFTLSRIIFFVNDSLSLPVKRYLLKSNFDHVWKRASTSEVVLPQGLDPETKNKIKELIKDAKKEDGDYKINLRKAFLKHRLELLDKNIVDSTMMQTLDIFDLMVALIGKDEGRYEVYSKNIESEMAYYRRFTTILNILLRDTLIDASEEEHTSTITEEIMISNSKAFTSAVCNDRVIGKRIDMIIKSCGVELSTSQWKKKGTNKSAGRNQQVKNVRDNKSILKHLLSLPINDFDKKNVFCLGLDFIGTVGYMFSVHNVDDVFVANFISDLELPEDLSQLEDFVETVDFLYKFKNHHLKLQEIIIPAHRHHENQQSLAQHRTPAKRKGSAINNDNDSDSDDDVEMDEESVEPYRSPNTFVSPRKKKRNSRLSDPDDA